jgi:hypothetical protein
VTSRASAGRARAQELVTGAQRTQYTFGVVLVLILVSLTFQVAAPETELARFAILSLHGLVLLSGLFAARAHPVLITVAVVAVVASLLVSGFALIGPGEVSEIPAAVVNMMFVGLTPIIVARGLIREIREDRTVTWRTITGVLCIYLLIGIFFAFVYGVIDSVDDATFFPHVGAADTSDFLYFSFTTLTTTGYGDLVTENELGRSMAVAEALIGQIYLVTVVALIVSNFRPPSRRSA